VVRAVNNPITVGEAAELSERQLSERLQELKEIPFLDQGQSLEYEIIEDELYRRARDDRKHGAAKGL